jgi:hypothetical protein
VFQTLTLRCISEPTVILREKIAFDSKRLLIYICTLYSGNGNIRGGFKKVHNSTYFENTLFEAKYVVI